MKPLLNSPIHLQAQLLCMLLFFGTGTKTFAQSYELRDRVRDHADVDVQERGTVLAKQKIFRTISMFYKIDLHENNSLSQGVADVMRQYEHKVRGCYSDRLDRGHKLKGRIALKIRMSRSTGRIKQVKRVGGDIKDKVTFKCIRNVLARLPLNVRKELDGTLIYNFDSEQRVTTETPRRRTRVVGP